MAGYPGLAIQRDVNIPYYEQLKRLIVQQIAADGLEPGDLLPSEGELCERYGVSRTVVRQAVGDLVNEGLLQRMRGKGTFVGRPKLREQFIESTVGFFEDLTARGETVESVVLSLELVPATAKVAKALAGRAVEDACTQAQQCYGAIGFTWEHEFHRYLRRTYVLDWLFGGWRTLEREIGARLLDTRVVPRIGAL